MRALLLAAVSLSACTVYAPPVAGDDVLSARTQRGDIVITELMAAPSACTDAEAEWIEVRNVSDQDRDLNGLRLRNAAGVEVAIASERTLRAGETMQIGRGEWDTFCVGQIHPHAYFGAELELANDGEALELLDTDGALLDATPFFPADRLVRGMSVSLLPDAHDAAANDDLAHWYLGDECINTAGTSPGVPNPDCLAEVSWFGLECVGCPLNEGFDPLPWLRDAHALASGILDEQDDIDRDGVFFHHLAAEVPGGVNPRDWDPAQAQWTVTFVTHGTDPWGYQKRYIDLHVNDGTYEVREAFSTGTAWLSIDALDQVTMTTDDVADALHGSWSWWGDVGRMALSKASYHNNPSWNVQDPERDDHERYDAVTGEKQR